nr:MAG TPA: hypothetical protein [Caudoviricetes sp.]
MRGKRPVSNPYPVGTRITPAHAGKTQQLSRISRIISDHPRACGENLAGL